MGIADAAGWCDLIMFTMPDELQAETYKKYVHDLLYQLNTLQIAQVYNLAVEPLGKGDFFDLLTDYWKLIQIGRDFCMI